MTGTAHNDPAGFRPPAGPRLRVISDNDYAGDPDGLVQLAHLLLSPAVEVRAVIGSHLAPGDAFDDSGCSAAHAVEAAALVSRLAGRSDVRVVTGSETALGDVRTPERSPGAELIVAEAMREDTDLPLVVTLGGGLTELASAYLLEPAIAERLTAIWIGGPEHLTLGAQPPPGAMAVEYNLNIDLSAAQVVFDSPIPLWQVPRNAYRETLASMSELMLRLRPHGALGRHLYDTVAAVHTMAARHDRSLGETYVMGDNPLVLLTALQSSFEPDPSSSTYALLPRPRITDAGGYEANPLGAPLRVYSGLDTRLMFEDLYAKLALAAIADSAAPAPFLHRLTSPAASTTTR